MNGCRLKGGPLSGASSCFSEHCLQGFFSFILLELATLRPALPPCTFHKGFTRGFHSTARLCIATACAAYMKVFPCGGDHTCSGYVLWPTLTTNNQKGRWLLPLLCRCWRYSSTKAPTSEPKLWVTLQKAMVVGTQARQLNSHRCVWLWYGR
jgi:hypothetical protein